MTAARRGPVRFLAPLILAIAVLAAGGVVYTQVFAEASPEVDNDDSEPSREPVLDPPKPKRPLVMPPALIGRVLDAETMAPVGNATVTAECPDADPGVAVSRPDGRFVFKTLPPGTCEVRAAATERVAAGPDPEGRTQVRIRPGRTLSGVRIDLYRTAIISGRVQRGGKPVANASLSVLTLESPGADETYVTSTEVVTDETGTFRLEGLGPGRVRVMAEHDEYGLAESDDVFLKGGGRRADLLVELSDVGDVVGMVRDEQGRPIPGAKVVVTRGGMVKVLNGTSGDDGRFAIGSIPEGAVRVVASAHGFHSKGAGTVTVVADDSVSANIVLRRRTGFGGRVVAPSGEPVGKAAVYTRQADLERSFDMHPIAFSDDDGYFWVDAPPPSPAVAWARHAKWAPADDTSIAGTENDLTLTLGRGGALAGRVVDGNGDPLSIYRIQLLGTVGARHAQGASMDVKDPDGRFVLSPVEPGRWALVVTAAGRPEAHTRKWLVVADSETDVGDIVLDKGGTITGRLVDAKTGQPVQGGFVGHEGVVGMRGRRRRARTDKDGRFKLEGVPSGTAALYLRSPQHLSRLYSGVQVSGGGTTDLGDLTVEPRNGGGGMQYSGVGVSISFRDDRVVLRQVFDGGPAAQAGLTDGTAILRINGMEVANLNPNQVVQMIRGESGTEVALEIVRPESSFQETIKLERGEVIAR